MISEVKAPVANPIEPLRFGGAPPDDRWFRLLVEGVRDYAIFMLDLDGRITTWNAGAERLKGYRPDEILGRHFSCFYPADAAQRGWPEWELEIARSRGHFEDESWRIRKDGSKFWANVIITALTDEAGVIRGFSKITRDLTDRRRNEEALRHSEERFRVLVEGVQDYAIITLDPQGRVTSWNSGAERTNGYRAEEILGQDFSRFFSADDRARAVPERELENARQFGRVEVEGWRIRKDGSSYWANVMVTALHDQTAEARGFAMVIRDMTQRKRVELLEESQRQTHEFLAMLAHELRNPLAPIRNALSLMGMKDQKPGTLEWSTGVIDRQVTHLTRLVDDLLEVSRLTRGKIALQLEAVDLSSVITGAVESSRAAIEARGHRLEVALPDEPLSVSVDPTRLSQVVLNLLNNAAKYTPEGGFIRLSADRERDRAVIRIRDSGIGIPYDLLPRVFDLFVQGNRALDRSDGGLGIGLTLVERLVTMHGGSVEALSEGPGRGSEFIVRLPLRESRALPDVPGHEPARTRLRPRRRLLVVDDNSDAAETLAKLLRSWGHDVDSVLDPWSALMLAVERQPEVILLDIGLPGMTGYELAERLRAQPTLRNATLIAVTGYGQEEDRRRTRSAGFKHHLTKPVDAGALDQLIESLPLPPPRD